MEWFQPFERKMHFVGTGVVPVRIEFTTNEAD